MKYCTNCKVNKESWADKGYSGENYDKKCWNCGKYTLGELVQAKMIMHEQTLGCGRGGYFREDIYRNGDGSSTRTYIQRGNMRGEEMRMEVPPKRSPSPDCKIL